MTTPDQSVTVTDDVVNQIAAHLGDGLTAEQVNTVLSAWNAVRQGAAIGTVLRDPATGHVAHRVDAAGVHQWRCSGTDGAVWSDMQPTLAWGVLYSPAEAQP